MGGNAFPDTGTIHISEIQPTLEYIGSKINVKTVAQRTLGSTGKKEYSGDIDLAMDSRSSEEMSEFFKRMKMVFGENNVRKQGALIMTRVPIQEYHEHKNSRQPRTGTVQVDYMFGDTEWFKLYYHSPADGESKLKGTHRNIALSTLAGFTDREASDLVDDYERPVESIRYKWSPTVGLVKVRRTSRKNEKTGKWIKKQDEELLSDSITDANEIVAVLFGEHGTVETLNSAELIIEAIKKVHDNDTQAKIFERMAANFTTHHDIGKIEWDYPEEIAQYI